MSGPRVPWSPQSLVDLQRRYPAAAVELIDQTAVLLGTRAAPSGQMQHVFDFENGLRLIVSRERQPDGAVGIHFSASRGPSSSCFSSIADAVHTWRRLAQSDREPEFLGVSEGGIPHWWVEERH